MWLHNFNVDPENLGGQLSIKPPIVQNKPNHLQIGVSSGQILRKNGIH